MRRSLMLLAISAAWLVTATAPARGADSVRVLLVTGMDFSGHHWKETAPAIRKVLEQDKRFDVRIVEDPEFPVQAPVAEQR